MARVAVESIVVSAPNGDDVPIAATADVVVRPPRRTSSMLASTSSSSSAAAGAASPSKQPSVAAAAPSSDGGQPTEWGQNFWVTLVDPQTQAQFYACPSTGHTTWDAPVGNFVLPPSADGEWWELRDETRGGMPYYYHTKSGDTTWTRPDGFIIPLGVIQNTTLGRKLSQSTRRHSQLFAAEHAVATATASSASTPATTPAATPVRSSRHAARRSISHAHSPPSPISERTEDAATSPLPTSDDDRGRREDDRRRRDGGGGSGAPPPSAFPAGKRSRSKSSGALSSAQSLAAAVEFLAASRTPEETASAPDHGGAVLSPAKSPPRVLRRNRSRTPERRRTSMGKLRLGGGGMGVGAAGTASVPATPVRAEMGVPMAESSPRRGPEMTPRRGEVGSPSRGVNGTEGGFWRPRRKSSAGSPSRSMGHIGRPVLDVEATQKMSPVKRNGKESAPIHVATKRMSTGEHPLLPRDLVTEIQQFAQSDFARRYFSTHREGLIFRRKVPVERMMMWQKAPLTSPLLVLNKALHRDAVRAFKVVQRIMGDRDRDRPVGVRHTDSSSSLAMAAAAQGNTLLEEERWLLGEGVLHGEMRDEIYCQVIKQLCGNSNTESTFRGWQLLCVLLVTFPPSKNFEPYVRGFMQQRTAQAEGRVDVMAKYCLQRLAAIAKKGPRGKPPTIAEIESASDAAFNPATFGESLDAVFRLQARTYGALKVPVVLPFLADGILALGGTRQEGIFRVPGDADAVAGLRLRIDRGVYTLDGVDDPHVPASLLKLWLRELLDPLVPAELYNECVACADAPERVVAMIARLPTINRRVVLFVVSFLQLFLEERVQAATKMTSANLALVMAPNLLRCDSDSMSVVFTNAQYEQRFVHNLLLHLRCDQVDPDYIPEHGKGAVTPSPGRKSHQKSRRPKA